MLYALVNVSLGWIWLEICILAAPGCWHLFSDWWSFQLLFLSICFWLVFFFTFWKSYYVKVWSFDGVIIFVGRFFILFHCFVFFILWLDNFKCSVFEWAHRFFYLIKFAVETFYWFFSSLIGLFISGICIFFHLFIKFCFFPVLFSTFHYFSTFIFL